jgi:hypothetical protein
MSIVRQITIHRLLFSVGFLGIVVAAMMFMTVRGNGSETASAASDGEPEMALNLVWGGNCDDPVHPTKCTVLNGSQFLLTIDAVAIPANGYVLAQARLHYGDDLGASGGAVKSEDAMWPDCFQPTYLTANSNEDGNGNLDTYAAGCLTSLFPPQPVSFHQGSLFTLGLTCPIAMGAHVIDLMPANPALITGASFTDADSNQIIPKVSPLTISCQPPDSTPFIGVNGTLFESQSGFMRGATVRLEPLGIETTTSEQDGSFSFILIPDGIYTIVVVNPGCTPFGCYYPYPVVVSGEKVSVSIYPKPFDGDTDGDQILNDVDPDDDNDGCTDVQENGPDEKLGGRRSPHSPWDFYDVAGPGTGFGPGPPDGIIDLPFDILGVVFHYAPSGIEPAYDVDYDRGPSAGPHPWNMTAPDGVIDLSNDILGVVQQYQHSCQ